MEMNFIELKIKFIVELIEVVFFMGLDNMVWMCK